MEALRDSPVAAPVFFTVCGTNKGEACVIERTYNDAVVRGMNAIAATDDRATAYPRVRNFSS